MGLLYEKEGSIDVLERLSQFEQLMSDKSFCSQEEEMWPIIAPYSRLRHALISCMMHKVLCTA